MPLTTAAKKALKKSLKRKKINIQRKETIKKTEKQFRRLIAESKIEEAKKTLTLLYKLLDKAAKKHLFKKNKVARDKSRLAKLLKNK